VSIMSKKIKNKNDILAIFFSDPHFSLNPPPLRSSEPDWFEAQKRPLDEIKTIQKANNCPVFCSGDVFDQWKSPPEIINWAIDNMPFIISIPGQHDLPEHDITQINKSAFKTLQNAKKINKVTSEQFGNLWVRGFPYGVPCEPLKINNNRDILCTALIHQYNWIDGACYKEGLSGKNQVTNKRLKYFRGYDFVFSGDNHIPFRTLIGKTHFINCGSIIRRSVKDLKWHPSIWLLRSNREVQKYKLDVSQDKYLDTEKAEKIEQSSYKIDISNILDSLGKLGQNILDVKEAFEHAFTEASKQQ